MYLKTIWDKDMTIIKTEKNIFGVNLSEIQILKN